MVCPYCGYQNRSGDRFCGGCGAALAAKVPEKKRSNGIVIAALLLAAVLVICFFTIHSWTDATCAEPQKCTICGKTQGDTLPHRWQPATCTEAKVCYFCGMREGDAKGHSWTEASCTEAKQCLECGEIRGEALGHSWQDATYDMPKNCVRCGRKEGERLGELGDMVGSWAQTPTPLCGWNTYPLIMPQTIYNCDYFTLYVEFGSYEEHPELYNVLWEIYIKTPEGRWEFLWEIPVDGPIIQWPCEFYEMYGLEPVSFTELVMIPRDATFSSYNIYYEVQDVHVCG